MIKNKTLCKILSCCLLMAMVMFPLFSIRVHAAEYEIVFKAGAHGTIDGNKEASYRLSSDDVFPDEPDIQVEKGYVFVGWNKQLPSVGSKVTGEMVYVAKYAVVIDGVTYTIRYVDENKVDIATPKTMLGELGSNVTARAKTIPGYTYQTAEQDAVVKDQLEILFVYTLTNPDEVVPYQSNTNNQAGTNNQVGTNDTQGIENNNTLHNGENNNIDNNGEDVNENGSQEEETVLGEGETPQAIAKRNRQMMMYAAGGGAALLAILLFLLFKRRKKEKEASQ